ncbi:MAG: hypothetical protein LBS09_07540 [Bacteroidales bacterium]|nr:hypothetical protein [Bacteroidales bacterium]
MNKILILLTLWMGWNVEIIAQNGSGRRGPWPMEGGRIQAERVAFFTKTMGLTVDEAQVFWPLYNEMEKKNAALFDEKSSILWRFSNEHDKLSDKEAAKLLDKLMQIQQQESEISKEYITRLRKVLPNSKVMKLYVAEFQFRTFLLQKISNNRNN